MQKGLFITFEGNDGCGKTTVSQMAYKILKEKGFPVIYTREPGGIEIAEQIRNVILDPKNTAMDPRCEALLYAASRRQHLVEKILPALEDKQIILCDRFIDSSLVYQGMARNIGIEEVYKINEFAIEGHLPDATIFLEVDLEIGAKRVAQRGNKDRLDAESSEFHKKVAAGYDKIKHLYAHRMYIINANQMLDMVVNDCMNQLMTIIEPYV